VFGGSKGMRLAKEVKFTAGSRVIPLALNVDKKRAKLWLKGALLMSMVALLF
jgi:hypothetical protein